VHTGRGEAGYGYSTGVGKRADKQEAYHGSEGVVRGMVRGVPEEMIVGKGYA
jgi:hypothetical protein